jgi:Protein of unknown function (DUF4236)
MCADVRVAVVLLAIAAPSLVMRHELLLPQEPPPRPPLRFNLSKRGVGVWAYVKGARLGLNAEGREYVAGGRYGLYYRERGRRVGSVTSGKKSSR